MQQGTVESLITQPGVIRYIIQYTILVTSDFDLTNDDPYVAITRELCLVKSKVRNGPDFALKLCLLDTSIVGT